VDKTDRRPGVQIRRAAASSGHAEVGPGRRFRHDLRRGLGAALLELQDCAGPSRYSDVVRWACLHVTTYDFQCEGGRGWYLHQAATLTGQADSILTDVIDAFARCRPDGWRFCYLSDILLQFAMSGSAPARRALWDGFHRLMKRYRRTVRRDGWWPSASILEGLALDLVNLDGWDAAYTAMSDFGEALTLGPAEPQHPHWQYFPDWFDSSVRERFGNDAVEVSLAGGASPALLAYAEVAGVLRTKPWRGGPSTPAPTVAAVQAVVEQARRGEASAGRVRSASLRVAQRRNRVYAEQVASLGLEEPDPDLKAALLWPFRTRPFPLPDDALMPLVDSDHDMLRHVVRSILGQRGADWKRAHALGLLQQGDHVDEALDLLNASYRPEDERAVDAAIRRVSVRGDQWHSAFSGVIDLLEPDDRPVTTGILDHIYRETLCSNCREYTLDLMRAKGIVSDRITQECHWDANERIRHLAAEIDRPPPHTDRLPGHHASAPSQPCGAAVGQR